MRVLVCGSRDFTRSKRLGEVLDAYADLYEIEAVIEGCAVGADRMAEGWARLRGVPVEHYPALWLVQGRGAGAIRNAAMLAAKPDLVLAFYRNRLEPSPGTRHMVSLARGAGVEVVLA